MNKYSYDDFGNVATNSVEGIANPFKYVGQFGVQSDAQDLLYMQARYYKTSLGRFINQDPIGLPDGNIDFVDGENSLIVQFIGTNLYEYSYNNPINWIDLEGLQAVHIYIPLRIWPIPAFSPASSGSCGLFRGHKHPRPSTWDKHTKPRPGDPEKGDDRRRPPLQRPQGWKGPYPPKK